MGCGIFVGFIEVVVVVITVLVFVVVVVAVQGGALVFCVGASQTPPTSLAPTEKPSSAETPEFCGSGGCWNIVVNKSVMIFRFFVELLTCFKGFCVGPLVFRFV